MRHNSKILLKFDSSISIDKKMNIRLRIPNSLGFVENVKVLFNKKGEEPGKDRIEDLVYRKVESSALYSIFYNEIAFNSPGYRTFCIQLKVNGVFCELRYDTETEKVCINDSTKSFWEMFVYYPTFNTPEEIKGGIMYQIYVDTFCSKDLPEHLKGRVVEWGTYPKWKPDPDGKYRNNQWYGGNLKGIISKLDYLKSLSVTVLYLTPIFKSSTSDRYGIDDYEEIDELVGTWDDLRMLQEECHKRGILYIQDEVFNHSGPNNELLKKVPDAYYWEHKYTKYKGWWGFELPEFDKDSPVYYDVLETAAKLHGGYVDGIRIDVADNMPDYSLKLIKNIFGKYMLLEVWKNAITGDFRQFLYGDEGDGVMNYQFPKAFFRYVRFKNVKHFKKVFREVYYLYPPEALNGSPIFLSSHDTPRIPNTIANELMKNEEEYENVFDIDKDPRWYNSKGEFDTYAFRCWEFENDGIPEEIAEEVLKKHMLIVFLQYTFPGLPSISAGDEVGVLGLKDPNNRKTFPWDKLEKILQKDDIESIEARLYDFYCKIGAFRMNYREVFSDSRNFRILYISDTRILYRRESLVFAVNITNHDISIPRKYMNSQVYSVDGEVYYQKIPAYTAVVSKIREE